MSLDSEIQSNLFRGPPPAPGPPLSSALQQGMQGRAGPALPPAFASALVPASGSSPNAAQRRSFRAACVHGR